MIKDILPLGFRGPLHLVTCCEYLIDMFYTYTRTQEEKQGQTESYVEILCGD